MGGRGSGAAQHPNKGKPQSAEAMTNHALKGSPKGGMDLQAHWAEVKRRNSADARIKELRARKLEVDAMEREGQLIRSELVGEWTRQLLRQFRAALDAADSLVDLRGHDPQTAESIRAIVGEVVGRIRHNIAAAPALNKAPPSLEQEGGNAP